MEGTEGCLGSTVKIKYTFRRRKEKKAVVTGRSRKTRVSGGCDVEIQFANRNDTNRPYTYMSVCKKQVGKLEDHRMRKEALAWHGETLWCEPVTTRSPSGSEKKKPLKLKSQIPGTKKTPERSDKLGEKCPCRVKAKLAESPKEVRVSRPSPYLSPACTRSWLKNLEKAVTDTERRKSSRLRMNPEPTQCTREE